MQEQAQGEHSHIPRFSLCFPRRRRRGRSTRPRSPRSRTRRARTAMEPSPAARGPSTPGKTARLPRRRRKSTKSSPGVSRVTWHSLGHSLVQPAGISTSPAPGTGSFPLRVPRARGVTGVDLATSCPVSPWAQAAPLSHSCCQHRLMTACSHPCCPTCPAGAAASSGDSWVTAALGWHSQAHTVLGTGFGVCGCCGGIRTPWHRALGCKAAPAPWGSANTASAGARSKRGSADTGSKHQLWSVCCLGKGWKINLCPLQLYFVPAPFFCALHTSSWAGLAAWRGWEVGFLGGSVCVEEMGKGFFVKF